MKKDLLPETYRKSIHLSSLILPFSYRYIFHNNKKLTFLFLVPITSVLIIIELFRLKHKTFKNIFYNFLGLIIRQHEHNDFTGATYLLMSSVVCIAIFSPDIAFLSLSFLAIGDTMAAIIGKTFGKRKLKNKKSLEGTLACFVSTFVFAVFFVHPLLAFFGAFSTAIAEVTDIPVDDNIKIPLISGLTMQLISIFLI